jgi:elongation factor G
MVDYLPSPIDIDSIKGINPITKEEEARHPSEDEPFSDLHLKYDRSFVGRLAFFRVYSGKLTAGSYVYNSTKDKKERVARLVRMQLIIGKKLMRLVQVILLLF